MMNMETGLTNDTCDPAAVYAALKQAETTSSKGSELSNPDRDETPVRW